MSTTKEKTSYISNSHQEEEGAALYVVRSPSWEVFKQGQASLLFRPHSYGLHNVKGTFQWQNSRTLICLTNPFR